MNEYPSIAKIQAELEKERAAELRHASLSRRLGYLKGGYHPRVESLLALPDGTQQDFANIAQRIRWKRYADLGRAKAGWILFVEPGPVLASNRPDRRSDLTAPIYWIALSDSAPYSNTTWSVVLDSDGRVWSASDPGKLPIALAELMTHAMKMADEPKPRPTGAPTRPSTHRKPKPKRRPLFRSRPY